MNSDNYDITLCHVTRGYVSESEGEEMAAQEVTLPQDLPGRGNVKSGQSAVRLTEVRASLTVRVLRTRPALALL